MPAILEPIDTDGNSYRVLLNGKRIGIVTRNISMGSTIWQHRIKEDDDPRGVFDEKEHAADQLAANHLNRKKR